MGLGPVPCVQPQRMDPGTLLQYLAQIYLLPPSPFMVCSPHFSWRTGSFSHLQPSCAPGVRGTVLPGGHVYPLRRAWHTWEVQGADLSVKSPAPPSTLDSRLC